MESKNILNIIKEELNKFINEYADDEIIDLSKINLQQEYDKLNQQLYNNELPKIPLVLAKIRPFGKVTAMRNRFSREIKIERLSISTFYKLPYKEFLNTLAHEMIHVKQLAVYHETGGHGYSFEREARRINNMGLGYNITATHGGLMDVSDEANEKELIAMIIHTRGEYGVTVTTPDVYYKDSSHLFDLMQQFVNQGRLGDLEITVVKSNNPQLQRYRIARTFARGFSSSPLADNVLEQLLNDEIINQITIKRGVPKVVSEENKSANDAGAWEEFSII